MSEICIHCVAGFPHPATSLCKKDDDAIAVEIKEAVASLGRPPKDDADMKDPVSTGRKRAAEILPDHLLATMICEWALLKEAGGGNTPIEGCHGNIATDRHHGPDKNTLNNNRAEGAERNLHAVCSFCHNRWHAKNDPSYQTPRPFGAEWLPVGDYKPHNNVDKMSVKQALINELTRYKD